MIFELILSFITISITGLIISIAKRKKKLLIISLVSLCMFSLFGFGVFLALGSM